MAGERNSDNNGGYIKIIFSSEEARSRELQKILVTKDVGGEMFGIDNDNGLILGRKLAESLGFLPECSLLFEDKI